MLARLRLRLRIRFGRIRFKTILADYNHTQLLTLNEAARANQLLLIIRKEN